MDSFLFFSNPLAIFLTMSLPVIWLLLRMMPLQPKRIFFPAIQLLKKNREDQPKPRDIPLWLKILRIAIFFFLILGLAKPVLQADGTERTLQPITLVIDNGVDAAPFWDRRLRTAENILKLYMDVDELPVNVITTAPEYDTGELGALKMVTPRQAMSFIQNLSPQGWGPDYDAAVRTAGEHLYQTDYIWQIHWLGSGGHAEKISNLYNRLSDYGDVIYYHDPAMNMNVSMTYASRDPNGLNFVVSRRYGDEDADIPLFALNADGDIVAQRNVSFSHGRLAVEGQWELPKEVVDQVDRLRATATPTLLQTWNFSNRADMNIGILAREMPDQKQDYLNDSFYIARAVEAFTQPTVGRAADLSKNMAGGLIVWPDSYLANDEEREALSEWTEAGGTLLRFAGVNMLNFEGEDRLLPVEIYRSGRRFEGAMNWGTPARVGAFSAQSPYASYPAPQDINVTQQVLARPTLDIDEKTWVRLEDETPLVTAQEKGNGQIVLVHTSADNSWSDFTISKFFPTFLNALAATSGSAGAILNETANVKLAQYFDAFGQDIVSQRNTTYDLRQLKSMPLSIDAPAGHYVAASGEDYTRNAGQVFEAVDNLDTDYYFLEDIRAFSEGENTTFGVIFLIIALGLFVLDAVITFLLLRGVKLRRALPVLLFFTIFHLTLPTAVLAQSDISSDSLTAQENAVDFAYIITGNERQDAISRKGLENLGRLAKQRTTIEFGNVKGVDPVRDDLNIYPFLYWPMTSEQTAIDGLARENLQDYIDNGGLLVFDTRDARFTSGDITPGQDKMRTVAGALDFAAMSPVGKDHVINRSYYLIQEYPGAYTGGPLWAEQSADIDYDGVPSVIVGGNDWAAEWANAENAGVVFTLPPQTEQAMRFGINLTMLALTGSYKADQIHVDNILDRIETND